LTNRSQSSRTRSIVGTFLIFLPGVALGFSSILKFAGVPGIVHKMALAGFTDGKLILVATLELASAFLFLYSRTRAFGLLFLSAFLGGAICSHVQTGELSAAVGPAGLLTLAWTGSWLRHPEMLWSFDRSSPTRIGENIQAGLPSREA